jgi:membrane-bound lytic murein transglycosylase F
MPVEPTPLPPASWQVVEIEGEATPITTGLPTEQPLVPAPLLRAPPALVDDKIVVGLDTHHLTIAAGETALFGINVLNNGERRAHFELTVTGALDEQWLVVTVGEHPPQPFAPAMTLEVGDRATFWLAVTPPRTSHSGAGDHPLHITVRAAEYPGRFSQLTGLLTILPYVDFTLGMAKPPRLATTWRQQTRQVTLPLHNRSNQPLTLALHSRTSDPHFRCELVATGQRPATPGQLQLTLAPGQRTAVTARITLIAAPWLRLEKQRDAVQIVATPLAQPAAIQSSQVAIHTRALFGPWHLAALLLLVGGGLVSALLVAVIMLVLALRPPPPVLTNPPPISAPPVAIVVNLAQPAATVSPINQPAPPAPAPVGAGANIVNLTAEQANPNPALPIIEPGQISAPGAPAAAAPQAAVLAPPPANAAVSSPKTYQTMFLEIALRYDLNWRVLAAQAYIESSFDPLALGNSGELGLMQILPSTWREWAPTVNATDPFDSYSNTWVAAAYLDYLRQQLGKKGYPQIEWMLVAYNWGIDKVLDHLAAGQGWNDLPPARRQYALDILRVAETIPQ